VGPTKSRKSEGQVPLDYPFHDKTIVVTRCGRICVGNKKINFSQVFAGQAVGRFHLRRRFSGLVEDPQDRTVQ
jgi:hypothetical protein